VDESALDELLSEQRRYYRARAPEYDDWWFRRGRYALDAEPEASWFADVAALEAALGRFDPAGDVLELAAGTGIWTSRLVTYADRLTAVDASPEVLERNRERSGPGVEHVVADIFGWEPPRVFDACFFAFWLSHVPRERVAEFWGLVARALRPDGRLFLIENARSGDRRHTVGTSDEVARRSLADGREFDIVKRFWSPAELEQEVAAFGFAVTAAETPNRHFLYASGRPAVDPPNGV
jgi:demethylmenaquinone methyltransferase/2-methoxy-6-polyprenyl-1,4-benzoquinol methylase